MGWTKTRKDYSKIKTRKMYIRNNEEKKQIEKQLKPFINYV